MIDTSESASSGLDDIKEHLSQIEITSNSNKPTWVKIGAKVKVDGGYESWNPFEIIHLTKSGKEVRIVSTKNGEVLWCHYNQITPL